MMTGKSAGTPSPKANVTVIMTGKSAGTKLTHGMRCRREGGWQEDASMADVVRGGGSGEAVHGGVHEDWSEQRMVEGRMGPSEKVVGMRVV
jgi:hypothetical protein